MPNSGKTSLLRNLRKLFENSDLKVAIIQESAELLPKSIPKGSLEQNMWINLETMQRCLELKYYTDVDFILLDRGIFNQMFWTRMYKKNSSYASYADQLMRNFESMFQCVPDYIYVVDCKVDEAIKRRMASGEPITFSNKQFLEDYQREFKEFLCSIDNEKIRYIDTTHLNQNQVANAVYEEVIRM